MSANEQKSLWNMGGGLLVEGEILYLKKTSFEHQQLSIKKNDPTFQVSGSGTTIRISIWYYCGWRW